MLSHVDHGNYNNALGDNLISPRDLSISPCLSFPRRVMRASSLIVPLLLSHRLARRTDGCHQKHACTKEPNPNIPHTKAQAPPKYSHTSYTAAHMHYGDDSGLAGAEQYICTSFRTQMRFDMLLYLKASAWMYCLEAELVRGWSTRHLWLAVAPPPFPRLQRLQRPKYPPGLRRGS